MQGASDGSVVDDVVSCGANGDNILGAAPERCHGDVRLPRSLECGSVCADLGFSEATVFGAQMGEDLEERMGGDAGGAVDELLVVFFSMHVRSCVIKMELVAV